MADECCSPGREPSPDGGSASPTAPRAQGVLRTDGMVRVEGGTFWMGSRDGYPDDGEQPVHEVHLEPFLVDETAVTNAAFAEFVGVTGHVTEAERFGWSFVFGGLLPDDFPDTRGIAAAPWWRQVHDADWRHPDGPRSSIERRLDHPVVHVSWNDALAHAAWAGKRLLTEAEWECAARGGMEHQTFPWGDDLEPEGEHRMNVWQGEFPSSNTVDDGHLGAAPVRSYPPNGFGLYETTGNVWEWVADWFSPEYYAASPVEAPPGPDEGTFKVMRGGSYLCHASYCRRYRVAARSASEPESSTGNTGFRCGADA